MAASQASVGGYRCEFIDAVYDDFIRKVCNCVARVERKGRATRHSLESGLRWQPVRWCWVSWQMWPAGSETSTGHSCCKQVFQAKLYLHALWIQSHLGGCQWETLARVPELPSIMPQQMSDWGSRTQHPRRPLALRSFRGKTWRNTLKTTFKNTWHWWHLRAWS